MHFYGEFLGRFIIALVLLLAGVDLIVVVVSRSIGHTLLRILLILLATVVGAAWGQAAMVADFHDRRDGKGDASILEVFIRTWRAAPHIAWATFCAGFLVGLVVVAALVIASLLPFVSAASLVGVLLALATGLYLAARWSLIIPVIVIERQNRPGAFFRSAELVVPYRGTVIGVLLISLVVAGGIDLALGTLVAHGLQGWAETWLADVLNGLIFSSALVAVSTAIYYELLEAGLPARSTRRRLSPEVQPWTDDVSRLAR